MCLTAHNKQSQRIALETVCVALAGSPRMVLDSDVLDFYKTMTIALAATAIFMSNKNECALKPPCQFRYAIWRVLLVLWTVAF
jgi:hypothetical protein